MKKCLTIILIISSFYSCKTQDLTDNYSSKLTKSLNFILTKIIETDLKKFPFIVNNDKLILYVSIKNKKDLFRESNLLFDIQLWNKEHFDIKTNYEYNGIRIYFGNTKKKYRDMFNTKYNEKTYFKIINTKPELPKKEKLEKGKQTIKRTTKNSIKDPITWTNIYFNSKLEVTYIDREQYINLLKENIDFDKNYFE